ncbi:NAD(P)/FAD-dependent oxidoreductase [Rhizobium sp. LjRoot254]|uniref:NAD(P)/FAD-dependent oxidoreductase n=1 Tax=Rhizobium sp. LjRoot254 TaxID=3342297 RepID=UPI003ED0E64C
MTLMDRRIVIVGAGQAGFAAAAKLRKEGFAGAVTLVGMESTMPYQRPPLSKAYLLGKIEPERLLLRDEVFYLNNNIEVLTGERVVAIDRAAKIARTDTRGLPYDQLILATGARPARLPARMTDGIDNVFHLRTKEDADHLRPILRGSTRLLVIGGGYVGLEVAAAARQSGADVALVEAAPRILNRVAAEPTAAFFRTLHRSHGVRLFEGAGLVSLLNTGGAVAAELTDGTELLVDAVVVGVGVRPNTEIAEEAGLTTVNGIAVNPLGQTSDPCVWAAGDCACFEYRGETLRIESVPHAIDQAEHVALNILGARRPYQPRPWFWSDQYGSKLQIAGLNRGFDRVETSNSGALGNLTVHYFQRDELVSVDCVNDARGFMSARRELEAKG